MKPLKWIASLLISGALYAASPTIEQRTPAGSGGVTPTSSTTLPNKTIDDASNTLTGVYTSASILRAREYGILPTNTDVQNDAGFAKLKTKMQSSTTTVWRVIFEPGAYTYTNNRWLYGVQNVIIDGYGSTFQDTASAGGYRVNHTPLYTGSAFGDGGDAPYTSDAQVNGYLFNTASAGATSITTTTAADAGNFSAGMRVVLHGYDQQGEGLPPNMRYFEYKTVATANASTGVITFTNELAYFYDSRWWDTANYANSGKSFGAPRILSLERANYAQPRLIWLRGGNYLPGANGASQLQTPADLVIYENVTAQYVVPTTSDRTYYKRCNVKYAEPDKVSNVVVFEDSVIDTMGVTNQAITGATGINNLAIIRTKVIGGNIGVSPRQLRVENADITPATSNYQGITTHANFGNPPTRSMSIGNTRVNNTGQTFFATNTASPGFSLTVGRVSGTDILVSFDATGKKVAHSIDYGTTLTNTVTGNKGTITGIYYDAGSPGNLHITGTWATPTAGDVFYFYDVMARYDGGGNSIVGTQIPFWRSPPAIPSGNTGTLQNPRSR